MTESSKSESMGGRNNSEEESSSQPDDSHENPQISTAVLDVDYVFEALAHPRRRYLLYTLAVETVWSVRELATKLAAWEQNIPEETVRPDERDKVYISLYHTHIPILEEYSVISFDAQTETIEAAVNAEQVIAALEGVGASIDSEQESHAHRDNHELFA
jgi:predicted transcriptional regulator